MPTPAPLCTHTMPSGATCGSPAVSWTTLCYHHSALKTALGKAASGGRIPFVFPEDRASLQINYFLLLQAFTTGDIDFRTFNSMQRLLRSMDANLGKMPLAAGHANAAEPPATENPSSESAALQDQTAPQKQIKKPAAPPVPKTVNSPQPVHSIPVTQKPAQPKPSAIGSLSSFEEIAAQHKPLQAECFLILPNQPRFSDPLTGFPLTR